MSSAQFGNNYTQQNPGAPPPGQWNAPPGSFGQIPISSPQMWNQPTPQQWNNPTATIIPASAQSNLSHQELLKGSLKGLGITLIVVGILNIGMGIGLIFTATYIATYSGISFWGAILNIIAGSLAVAAVSRPSMCLINGALGVSIVISIISWAGLIMNIVDFFVYYYCYGYYDNCNGLIIGGHVIRGLFIITYLLQFSVSVAISAFACRARNHASTAVATQVFMIQNPATVFQPSTIPGSSQPYMMQSGVTGGQNA